MRRWRAVLSVASIQCSKARLRVKAAVDSRLALPRGISYKNRMVFTLSRWPALVACCVLAGWGGVTPTGRAEAGCAVETSVGKSGPFTKRLAADCTMAERDAHAIDSALLLEAMSKGRPVDLVGVVIRGEVMLDRLPVQSVSLPKGLPPEQQAALSRVNAGELRSVSAAVTIRDAIVLGAVRHRSSKGTLQFEGRVDFHGTRFKEGVDLSRSVFQRSVDLSAATFEREAYWVQGQFGEAVQCAGTTFGPHTRFHRSVFRGPVDCTGALFDGMAEFLETTFEQPAVFANARFGSGTGFSGSRFKHRISFADAVFSREVFFGYAVFEAGAVFAGAQVLGKADFSNAVFKQPDDLSMVRFDQPPVMTNTTRTVEAKETGWFQSVQVQYGITLLLLLTAVALVVYAIKLK